MKPLKTKDFQLKTHLDRIRGLFEDSQCPARPCYIRYVSRPEYRRISRRGRPARLRGAPRIDRFTYSLKLVANQDFVFWEPECVSGRDFHTRIEFSDGVERLSGHILE